MVHSTHHSSIRKKRRGKLRHGVLLLHDNALVHKSSIVQAAIQYPGFIESNYPAYSPELAPSDYHLLSNLKNSFRSKNFETNKEAIMTLNHYLES